MVLNILPFDKRLEYWRNIYSFYGPQRYYIRAMLTMSNDIHNTGTRNGKHNLILPKVRTSMAKNTFKFSAARRWKELPGPVDQYIFAKNLK